MTVLQALSAIIAGCAAYFWWRSAHVEIRDNIDKFMEDLREMSKWNLRASLANAALAALLAVIALHELF